MIRCAWPMLLALASTGCGSPPKTPPKGDAKEVANDPRQAVERAEKAC